MKIRPFILIASALALVPLLDAALPTKLDLQKGDHIAVIGSGVADRMQHHGWLEAMVQKQFPQQEVVFRNLGFTGDELTVRLRSDGVASQDEWLTKVGADVIVACYGFNESFKGYEGLEKFKADLDKFIKDTLKQKYNGKSAPRLVLVSPIAQEKRPEPIAQSAETNTNLQNYTEAMAAVAKANDVMFVDLFKASMEAYAAAKAPLTLNGIYLNDAGDKQIAPALFKALFPDVPVPNVADAGFEKLRAAVLDKNEMWYSRYRTVDQFNIFGGRSKIGYESGKGGPKITNAEVLHPEMAVRDVMTETRDKRVWAVAKGGDLKVNDSNVPAVPQIKSNKAGPNPDESWPYLSGEEAIKHMTVPKGCKVELVASEEQFPELVNPVQMNWDTKGRLWIAAWPNYPERTPDSKDGDKLLVLDLGPDGKAKKCTTFFDDLNCPTGFQFYKDGVLVMRSPSLLWVRDTDGDGKADTRERVLDGLDAADSHHETNSMCLEPGGAVFLSDGVFHRTQVETTAGPVRNTDGAIYRYEPVTGKFERYVAYGFANPHGRVFDYWGNDIITDATGNENFFGPAFSGRIDFPGKHSRMEQFWKRPSRPCPGTAFLSSRAFPEGFNGNFLNCNVISVQGIFRVHVSQDGSGLKGETVTKPDGKELDNLVTSDDPNFRPSGVSVAPDGSIYFMDWSQTIIGHLQHHLRDPNRDHQHGRIYRITYEGMPLLKPAQIDGAPIAALLDLLKEPEDNTRQRAKVELGKHPRLEVAAAAKKWAAALDKNAKDYEHHRLEALWVFQWHDVVDADFLKQVLASPEPRARAAATRVLCYWRDRVPDALALLKKSAEDPDPRVRLHAVRAASFFDGKDVPTALDVAYTSLKQGSDYYLDYTLKETLKQLNSLSKETILPSDPQILSQLIERMSDSELSKAPSTEPVLIARLERKGIDAAARAKAVQNLAKLHKTDRVSEIVAALTRLDAKGGPAADDLGKMLVVVPAVELAKSRPVLVALGDKAQQGGVRRATWAAVIVADADPAKTWAEAKNDPARDAVVQAIDLVVDPGLRAKFQPILVAALGDPKLGAVRGAALRALPLMGAENSKGNFAILAKALVAGQDRASAARSLVQLPRDSWDKDAAAPAAASVLNWAKTVPAGDRTKQEFVETVQAGMELAALLPPADAALIRKELRGLGVSVFIVKTVREQMRYDTPRLVVEAGKPFEVIVENLDAMPHNLVFVEPGARQAVAEAVQTYKPDALDKKGRAYVPTGDKRVLEATKLIEPGQKETIKMNAPKTEGEYEYVCTFPGHWAIMWGKLIVTKDVDAYLAAHPQASTAPVVAPMDHSARQQASIAR